MTEEIEVKYISSRVMEVTIKKYQNKHSKQGCLWVMVLLMGVGGCGEISYSFPEMLCVLSKRPLWLKLQCGPFTDRQLFQLQKANPPRVT